MKPLILTAAYLLAISLAAAETRPVETGGFAFDLEATVGVPPARAFDAFTRETLSWWDHHFSERPKSLSFELRPGGGFVEVFDDAGNGAWHATVLFVERPKMLRFAGPLGLSGNAIDMVHTLKFEPVDKGTRIKLSVHATGEYDKSWPAAVESVWKHFLVERFVPYALAHPEGAAAAGAPATSGSDALVAATLRYRDAKKRRDAEGQRTALASGAKLWFERKEGAGSSLEPSAESGDPWADWDRIFHSTSTVEATAVDGQTVRLTISEVNDWYRLVGRSRSRYHVNYDFDAQGKIAAVLVRGIPDVPELADRLEDFKTWARANRRGLVDRLMPGGKLDPTLEKAKLWKTSLLEWRKSAGLEIPSGVSASE